MHVFDVIFRLAKLVLIPPSTHDSKIFSSLSAIYFSLTVFKLKLPSYQVRCQPRLRVTLMGHLPPPVQARAQFANPNFLQPRSTFSSSYCRVLFPFSTVLTIQ
jgi:hypothetical protein